MAKHKWLKLTGLVLVSHLILSNCQNKQETQTTPSTQTTQTTTSSSKKKTTPDKDKDKNKDTTTTTTTPESTEKAIPGVTVPTSDGFILTENSVILSRTKDGIVVDHNGHSHFIFYSDLLGTKFAYLIPAGVTVTTTQTVSEQSPAQPASSGDHHYVFDPADIVAEDANGYTVRHGDHYHYILKSSLTGPYNQTSSSGTGGVISPVQPSQTNHQLPSAPSAGLAGIDYPTSDGFLFDGTGMSGWTDLGLLVNHNGHLHLLLTGDLARSKWAYLLASRPGQPPAPTVSNPTPSAPDKPSQPAQPVVPVKDEVAEKRAYLARETGNVETAIKLIDTPNGQAFMYPHDDHYHIVLLSHIDVTRPFDDGHRHDHTDPAEQSDNHEHQDDTHNHNEQGNSGDAQPSDQETSHDHSADQSATPDDSDNQAAPTDDTDNQDSGDTPPTVPIQDEVAVKRAYLAAATGLSESEISLLDTPDGPAFMYPHGDHHHVILLSQIDVAQIFDDGHGNHDHTDEGGHHDNHEELDNHHDEQSESDGAPSSDQESNQDTHTDDGGTAQPETSSDDDNQAAPTQNLEPQDGGEATTPTAPTQPIVPNQDDVAVKRAYLASATGLSESEISLLNTPDGPAFMYPHGDHYHVVLLSQLDVTKPFDDGHGDHGETDTSHDDHGQQGDDHSQDDRGDSGDGHSGDQAGNQDTQTDEAGHDHGSDQTGTTGEGHDHTDPAQDSGNQAGGNQADGDTTSPTDPDQSTPPSQPSAPTPPVKTGVAGIDYPTSDGFLFDGTGMAGWTSAGLLVNHNGHTHILPTEAIANSKWAHLLPKVEEATPTVPVELSEQLTKQRDDLAKQLGLNVEDIRVVTADGKVVGFEYPHEDHYDFVPANTSDGGSTELTEQDKRELTAYIRKTYGLLMGTPVTFHDDFVVFAIPHPHQDYDATRDYYSDVLDPQYDPGHVHPYAVPLSTLSIPVLTGIPELDFENELLLAAKRIGVAPSEVKIKDKKYFVLPGKDHDHYLNILTPVAGLDAYMLNKLPDIKANFAVGDYSEETVVTEADRVLVAAKDKFGEGTVEFRRVARALETFKANLTVAMTSTEAYLNALHSFEKRYVNEEVEADTSVEEKDTFNERYAQLVEQLKGFSDRTLQGYHLNRDGVLSDLKSSVANRDEAAVTALESVLKAVARVEGAPSDLGPRLAYMDYFLRQINDLKLTGSLRERMAEKILELYQTARVFRPQLSDTVALKNQVKTILATSEQEETNQETGSAYRTLMSKYLEIVNYVNGFRDFLLKGHGMSDEEKADGFTEPLSLQPATPKPTIPNQPTVEPPVGQPEQPALGEGGNQQTPPITSDPADSTEVEDSSLTAKVDRLTAKLEALSPEVRRTYRVPLVDWKTALAQAAVSEDSQVITRLTSYLAEIERIEQARAQNPIGSRVAHLDYFLRHIDKPYVSPTLRERMAQKILYLHTADSYEYQAILFEVIDMKAALQAEILANQTHDVTAGTHYAAFLAERSDIIDSVNYRRQHLLARGFITEAEKAEGFTENLPLP